LTGRSVCINLTLRNVKLLDEVLAALPALQESGACSITAREGNQSVRLVLKPPMPSGAELPETPTPPTTYDKSLDFMMRRPQ
jgi:hypothetical protein